MAPRILISAGEPSGDLHGAALARALKQRWPNAELYGYGGDRMAAAGVQLWEHADQMAVMGLVEVVRHLPFFLRLLRRTKAHINKEPPDIVIPIDYPGFNLRLARIARRGGVPVLYYIAPQVWAWHRSRMRQLARNADHLAVVLPFEEALFREAGAQVSFVGHPLLDLPAPTTTREQFSAQLGLSADQPLLAILPGSRLQEVRSHLELFAAAAQRLQRALPEVQPVVAQAPGIPDSAYDVVSYPRTRATADLLHLARSALTKSGTSTLECALSLTPMAIAYRMNWLTFRIAQRLVRIEHIGLVNLIAGRRIMPELVQDAATPAALADALLPLTREGPEREAALEALRSVRARLAPQDTQRSAERVADIAAQLLRHE